MDLGTIGIFSVGFLFHPDTGEVEDAAAELEELGFGALFATGWNGGEDVFPSFRRLLGTTTSIPVVSSIVNVWGNSAAESAAAFAEFERDFPGRFQLGLGIGHPSEVGPGLYGKPVAKMSAYLDELDRSERPVPRDRRILAALGPRMLELGGERTAGTIPYFVPVEQIREMRERLGPDATIAVGQRVLLETDPATARERARENIAETLTLTNYTGNLLRHGFEEDDLRQGGSDRLVDAMVAWGDEDAIGRRVGEYLEAGADQVWFRVLGGEHELAREEWRRIADLVHA